MSMLSNIDTLGILMWVLDGEVPLTPPKRSPGEDFIRVDIESESSSVTSMSNLSPRYRVYVFKALRPVGEFVNNVYSVITET